MNLKVLENISFSFLKNQFINLEPAEIIVAINTIAIPTVAYLTTFFSNHFGNTFEATFTDDHLKEYSINFVSPSTTSKVINHTSFMAILYLVNFYSCSKLLKKNYSIYILSSLFWLSLARIKIQEMYDFKNKCDLEITRTKTSIEISK